MLCDVSAHYRTAILARWLLMAVSRCRVADARSVVTGRHAASPHAAGTSFRNFSTLAAVTHMHEQRHRYYYYCRRSPGKFNIESAWKVRVLTAGKRAFDGETTSALLT